VLKNPNWSDGACASLWDASPEGLTYIKMPFSVYQALNDLRGKNGSEKLSSNVLEIAHILAIGCSIESLDEMILVQERGQGLLAGGMLDASSTGIGVPKDNVIDLEQIMLGKIGIELNLADGSLKPLTFTGNHEASDYTASMCTFKVKSTREFGQINEGRNKERASTLYGISKSELPGYLIDHYVGGAEPQIIGDGIATLMRTLNPDQFEEVTQELNRRGADIKFGIVKDRKFIETK